MTKQLIPHSKDELQTSTAEKTGYLKAAPSNPGNRHVAIPATHDTPGLLATGVSKTQSARLLGQDAIGEVNVPTLLKAGHKAGNVPQHPGTPARTFDPQPSLPDNRK